MADNDRAASGLANALIEAGIFDEVDCEVGNEEKLTEFIREYLARWQLVPRDEPGVADQVFGFWRKGIYQPVLPGVIVANDGMNVTFHYPPPASTGLVLRVTTEEAPRG